MTKDEAIKTLQELWRETNDSWYEEAYNMAIEALTGRPNGEWIEQYASKERTAKLTVCSECGWYDGYKAKNYNFCPNCGADMRGERHESSK